MDEAEQREWLGIDTPQQASQSTHAPPPLQQAHQLHRHEEHNMQAQQNHYENLPRWQPGPQGQR